MPPPPVPVRPTTHLIHRAAAISLNSARIIARSVELVTRSLTIAQKVARAHARASAIQVETLRIRTQPARRAAQSRFTLHIDRVAPMPLTSPKLLELAEEFRALATSAPTPESRAAFEDLVFRYTALAAGYDTEQAGSRMLH